MAETPNPFERARARLCLGKALRPDRRRSEARAQAHTAFELPGARPPADRAAAELEATGLTAAPRCTPVHIHLTPRNCGLRCRSPRASATRK